MRKTSILTLLLAVFTAAALTVSPSAAASTASAASAAPAATATTTATVAAAADSGRFLISVGGQQLGTEDFSIENGAARAVVELVTPGGAAKLQTELRYAPAVGATAYSLDAGPGGRGEAAFQDASATLRLPGLERNIKLAQPRLVLENNVFSHYQVLLEFYNSDVAGVQNFVALVPTAAAAYPITLERLAQAQGAPAGMVEYRAVLAGALGISIVADPQGRVMSVAIPAQAALAIRESYKHQLEELALSRQSQQPQQLQQSPQPAAAVHASVDVPFEARSQGALLRGTLTLPGDPAAGPYPVVVLVSGSGPQDRDGNTPPSYMSYMFRDIAAALSAAGVGVARYDDRGVGESEGDMAAAALHGLIDDARSVVAAVKAIPGVDPARIGIAGHSEGAYIAPILAVEDRSIAAVALLAGASATLDKVMIEQLNFQAGHPDLDDATRSMVESLRPSIQDLIDRAASGSETADANVIWVREHMQLTPVNTVAEVACPILIVQGDDDMKVLAYHADVLAEAAAAAPQVTLMKLANTTHEFLPYPFHNPDFDPMRAMQVVPELLGTLETFFTSALLK